MLSLGLSLGLDFLGCFSLGYSVIVRNGSSGRIDGANVIYGSFQSRDGTLPPGIQSTYLDVQEPIPERAEVTWIDAQKTEHRVPIVVKGALPKRFQGDLQFEILDGGKVVVTGVPREPR